MTNRILATYRITYLHSDRPGETFDHLQMPTSLKGAQAVATETMRQNGYSCARIACTRFMELPAKRRGRA